MYKKHLANFLIVLPIVSTIYIYFPILKTEFSYRYQPKNSGQHIPKSTDFGIIIPKLGINETIINDVDPFNKPEYMEALTKGIAHAKNTSTPDKNGTTYLFSHSSDNPFSITRYNTAFYLLPKLEKDDEIIVYQNGQEYTYLVTAQKIVKPWEVDILTNSTDNQLILQTCTPVGTSVNRLLVFAKPTTTT